MNSDQLIKFKTIVECGTLSKAAERLYVSQPALSYTIAAMEREAKCALFVREKNRLSLTPDGEILLQYANQISDTLMRAEQSLKNRDKIAISTNNIAASMILEHYPEEKLDGIHPVLADESEFPQLLLNGTMDAATCDDYYMREFLFQHPELQLEQEPMFEEVLGILVPKGHPLYDRQSITYADLRDIPLSVQADMHSLMRWIRNIEKMTGIQLRLEYPFDHITLVNLRHKLNCAEIRRSPRTMTSPDRDQAERQGYRFILLEDIYSSRTISLWYLKEKAYKIQPLLDSLERYRHNRGWAIK